VVTSFNGNTGAVTGASLGANTFTGLNSFNAGVSATGLTIGGSEGIEITRRLPVGVLLGEVNFLKGLSAELRVGNITGSEMVFSGRTASVFSPNTSLTIDKGATEGAPTTGDYAAAVRFVTKTGFNAGTATLAPVSGYTTDRTINLLTSQLMGAVNGSTAATTAVTSFNGNTGAVTGASLGANTFTGLNTFNAGVTTSFLYASTGSTFGSTLQVNGGATFGGRVDVGGVLDVVGGTTFDSTTDHAGVARFASGVTISGTLNGATATFSRWLSAPMGISTQTIMSRGNSLVLAGFTGGAFSSGSQIILPVGDAIQLNGYGGAVALSSAQAGSVSYNTSLKFMSEDTLNEIYGSVTLTPPSYTDGDYTLYLPNTANGTLALTSQLMGAVNGSTAATTAVTSFNGNTGAVTGASLGANTFTGLNTFNAGISAAGGVTFSGTIASDAGYRITSNAINAQTGTTYTFLSSDNGKVVTFNNGSTTTVTIPTGLPVGFNCTAIQLGAGQVGFTAASGVTMNAYASAYKISGQHGAAALISYTTNIFNLSGTLSA
jgi:hypothetical protein